MKITKQTAYIDIIKEDEYSTVLVEHEPLNEGLFARQLLKAGSVVQ